MMTAMNTQKRGSYKNGSNGSLNGEPARDSMTPVTVKLTVQEIELLISLAADQLFRKEFIEPKMPGFKSNSAEVSLGKALVARLRSIVDPGYGKKTTTARIAV